MGAETELDRIHICDLLARCIVGVNEEERLKRQDVVVNATLYADLSEACRSDRIEDTVDYKGIKNRLIEIVEASEFFLVEALAQSLADYCLSLPRIEKVRIRVDKPTALRFARSVGVEIVRSRTAGA
ncbi:dihydroneopterin aldolase [Candidatus Sumerlaeota bacterium]|nr:dihydroneopterin aldolase [Candidatus Sumerlaeota bacterium]